jgi:YD repeat-containing protein
MKEKPVMRYFILIIITVWATWAHADQRTFYDARGNVVGRDATDSQRTTTFYDARGNIVGKETRSSKR